jgi:hypothetical protein
MRPKQLPKLVYPQQMASITVSVPDDLASQLLAQPQQLPTILDLGLREINAGDQFGFDGAADVLELLAARVAEMTQKSRAGEMTSRDNEDWEKYEYLEHLVRMAKAAAQGIAGVLMAGSRIGLGHQPGRGFA